VKSLNQAEKEEDVNKSPLASKQRVKESSEEKSKPKL
jgi:hypothetical protein